MKTIPVDSSLRAKSSLWSLRTFVPVLTVWSLVSEPLAADLTGQFWWCGEGASTDTRIAYLNNDGSPQTVNTDNNPTADLISFSVADVGLDTAAGFYFAIVNDSVGQNARLLRGGIGSAAAPVVAVTFGSSIIVNALHVDPINKRIYTTWQEPTGSNPSNAGIRQYSYNPVTGGVTDLGFLVRADQDSKPLGSNGLDVLDARDFDLDLSINTIYFAERLTNEMGLYRINLATPTIITQMVSSTQFPDSGVNGYIIDVEVDPTTDKVYFTTESQSPFGSPSGYNAAHNKLWTVPQGSANATATAVTLNGLPAGSHLYPGDMVFDQSQRQLYIESEESSSISTDDVIYVFQLDAPGNTATLVSTLTPDPAFAASTANIQGMAFDPFATLTLTSNPVHVVEQGTPVSLLASDPTITDIDGGHLASATVTLGGSFRGSGDDLFVLDGAARRNSGLVTGTGITVSRTTDGSGNQKLTLTGHGTLAIYQQVLGDVRLAVDGDNPTNSGGNGSRTVTWQINDGAAGNPAMVLNAAATNLRTTTITIDAVNDNPVAVANTIARFPSLPTNVKITALLANDTDIDGDTLNFVSAGSAANGTVSVVGDMVVYTPNTGHLAGDSFTYTINDGHGGTAAGTVTVTIASGQDTATIGLLKDGTWQISFHGIIGMTYRIQSSDDLAPGSWITRTNVTADAAGNFVFSDPGPLPPRRFYRSAPP